MKRSRHGGHGMTLDWNSVGLSQEKGSRCGQYTLWGMREWEEGSQLEAENREHLPP